MWSQGIVNILTRNPNLTPSNLTALLSNGITRPTPKLSKITIKADNKDGKLIVNELQTLSKQHPSKQPKGQINKTSVMNRNDPNSKLNEQQKKDIEIMRQTIINANESIFLNKKNQIILKNKIKKNPKNINELNEQLKNIEQNIEEQTAIRNSMQISLNALYQSIQSQIS